jgi:CRP-like cAMP-binding protein
MSPTPERSGTAFLCWADEDASDAVCGLPWSITNTGRRCLHLRDAMDDTWGDITSPQVILGHLSYLLAVLAVSMSSMRWLRIFAIASGVAGAIYYGAIMADRVSFTWEVIFTVINVIQLSIIFLAGRFHTHNVDEKLLIGTVLPDLERSQRHKLLKLGKWRMFKPGDVLMEQGQERPNLVFIASGAASIERDQTLIGVCGPGDFLGEMSFLTGRPASATVRVANETRCCSFDVAALKALLGKNADLRQAMEEGFNRNLVGKLERMSAGNGANAARLTSPATAETVAMAEAAELAQADSEQAAPAVTL